MKALSDVQLHQKFRLGATIMERHKQAQPKRIMAVRIDGVWAQNGKGEEHFIGLRTLRRFLVTPPDNRGGVRTWKLHPTGVWKDGDTAQVRFSTPNIAMKETPIDLDRIDSIAVAEIGPVLDLLADLVAPPPADRQQALDRAAALLAAHNRGQS
jgi:hypothetical protein